MKKQVDLIYLSFMLLISSIIVGDVDNLIHSKEDGLVFNSSSGDSDKVIHSNAIEFEKYHLDGEGTPNGRMKCDLDGEEVKMTMRVYPGEFFRERMLTEGVMMQMVDINDNLPKMPFLPENIFAKLSPFSTSNIHKMMKVLLNVYVSEYAHVEKMMRESLGECEGGASSGEVKKCVQSTKKMVEFIKSVWGNNIVVRRTENVNGSGKIVVIGKVSKLNGGNVTLPITCHKHLFPYILLYYRHSNPMVRRYQVDLLEPKNIIYLCVCVCTCMCIT
jgi:hypothetical protein